jgi:hypothetical protein
LRDSADKYRTDRRPENPGQLEHGARRMSVFLYTDRGFPVVCATGEYEREDLHAALERAFASLRGQPSTGFVLDLSESASVRRRSAAEILSTFQMIVSSRLRYGSRLAVVARSDVGFGLMRMGLGRTGEHGLDGQAFRSYDQALAWLGSAAVQTPLGQTA